MVIFEIGKLYEIETKKLYEIDYREKEMIITQEIHDNKLKEKAEQYINSGNMKTIEPNRTPIILTDLTPKMSEEMMKEIDNAILKQITQTKE